MPSPKTNRVSVLRCPHCGATDVECDESRSVADISCMCCHACGDVSFVDSWERDFDWCLTIDLPADATALPAFVAPLAPGMGLHDPPLVPSSPSTSSPSPSPSPSLSPPPSPSLVADAACGRCDGADAEAAYLASHTADREIVVGESHFGVHLSACSCGRRFVTVFTERIDWRGGNDDQTWIIAAVSDAEVTAIKAADEDACARVVKGLSARRFLCRFWRDDAVVVAWREGALIIGPHD